MDVLQVVHKGIENLQQGVEDLRSAARSTDNSQAENALILAAQRVEDSIQQCRIAINQFR